MTTKRATPFCAVTWAGDVVRFTFGPADSVDVDTTKLSDDVQRAARMAGIEHTLRDAMAKPAGESGVVSPAEKRDAFKRRLNVLLSGAWSLRAMGGTSDDAMLYRAVAELRPDSPNVKTMETFLGWCRDQAKASNCSVDAFKTALAGSNKVRPIIERMEQEKTKGIDAEGMLGKL